MLQDDCRKAEVEHGLKDKYGRPHDFWKTVLSDILKPHIVRGLTIILKS